MNKKLIGSILLFAVSFIFSCKQGTVKTANSNGRVSSVAATPLSISSVVSPADSMKFGAASRYKKRSCCVGAPSRFRATRALAQNQAK